MRLKKAEEFLHVAQRCLEEGWDDSAVNRSSYAMCHAARAALASAGFRRPWWRHGSLQAAFSTAWVRRSKRYPAHFVPYLADAMALRHMADDRDSQAARREATRMVSCAAEFLSHGKELAGNA